MVRQLWDVPDEPGDWLEGDAWELGVSWLEQGETVGEEVRPVVQEELFLAHR